MPAASIIKPHDRGAADGLATTRHGDVGVEFLDHLDEFCGRPRMQAALVDDGQFARHRAGRIGATLR